MRDDGDGRRKRGLENKGGGAWFCRHSNIDWYSSGGAAVKGPDHCKLMLCGERATGGGGGGSGGGGVVGEGRRRKRKREEKQGDRGDSDGEGKEEGRWKYKRHYMKGRRDIFWGGFWAVTEKVEPAVRIWLHDGGVVL